SGIPGQAAEQDHARYRCRKGKRPRADAGPQDDRNEPNHQSSLQDRLRPEFQGNSGSEEQPVERGAAQREGMLERTRQISAGIGEDEGKAVDNGGSKTREQRHGPCSQRGGVSFSHHRMYVISETERSEEAPCRLRVREHRGMTSWVAMTAVRLERKLPLVFLAASVCVGLLAIAVNPPLRGPDEAAHFMRAYAIAHGEFVPRTLDARGRRGFSLPPPLNAQFRYFNDLRERQRAPGNGYAQVFRRYFDGAALPAEPAPTFVPYEGSEGYTPLPYLPYAAAAFVANAAGMEFLGQLYLMRVAGLFAAALITAYAIALTPRLKWMLFGTALLATALYQRAIISVDGAVLATTLLVIALCLRSIEKPAARTRQRALWMTLTCLTKPSQVAFVLLETMRLPLRDWKTQWPAAAVVMLPGIFLGLGWTLAASPDAGAWRLSEGSGLPLREFDPLWKLEFVLKHPLSFLAASLTSLDYSAQLWRQAIGVFGWLDVEMRSWTYPLISLALALTFFERLGGDHASRRRVALAAAATILAYYLLVCLLFFLTFSPSG